MDVIIYHNPQCGTSRNTLGLIPYLADCAIATEALDVIRRKKLRTCAHAARRPARIGFACTAATTARSSVVTAEMRQ